MKNTLPATKVRTQFFKILEETDHPGRYITITVDGEPKVVMMSAADFEGWQETLEIMADKELMRGIREGLKGKKKYSHESITKKFKIY